MRLLRIARMYRSSAGDSALFGHAPPQGAITPLELDELADHIRGQGTDLDSVTASLTRAFDTAAATSNEPEALNQLTRETGLEERISSSTDAEEVVRHVLETRNALLYRALVGAVTKTQQRNNVLNRLPVFGRTLERIIVAAVGDAAALHKDTLTGVSFPEGFLHTLCATGGPKSLTALAPLLTATKALPPNAAIPPSDEVVCEPAYSAYVNAMVCVCVPVLQDLLKFSGVSDLMNAVFALSQHCARMPTHARSAAVLLRVAFGDVQQAFATANKDRDVRSTIDHITFYSPESERTFHRDYQAFSLATQLANIAALNAEPATTVRAEPKRHNPEHQAPRAGAPPKKSRSQKGAPAPPTPAPHAQPSVASHVPMPTSAPPPPGLPPTTPAASTSTARVKQYGWVAAGIYRSGPKCYSAQKAREIYGEHFCLQYQTAPDRLKHLRCTCANKSDPGHEPRIPRTDLHQLECDAPAAPPLFGVPA